MELNPKKKYFHVSLVLETGRKVESEDITVVSDDTIDGFNLTRTDRLGDLVSNFQLDDVHQVTVSEISGVAAVPPPTADIAELVEALQKANQKLAESPATAGLAFGVDVMARIKARVPC